MSDDRKMNVINYVKFGELVRAWSDGTIARPRTVQDFIENVAPDVAQLIGYDSGEEITYIDLPPKHGELTFVIPAASDLADPIPDRDYKVPTFYGKLAFGDEEAFVEEANKELFRSGRIGDYSTAKCM